MTERLIRWGPDAVVLTVAWLAQAVVVALMLRRRARAIHRLAFLGALVTSWAAMAFGFALRSGRVSIHFSGNWSIWFRAVMFAWCLLSICWALVFVGVRCLPRPGFSAARRGFLWSLRSALFAAPAATLAYGVAIQRRSISLQEHNVPIAGLPKDLDGLRLVQITDIHMSPFFSRTELDYAVALANETQAHIALVTGDLITAARDPLDSCLAGLKPLRADAGVFGCLGNHEIYARAEDYTEQAGARQGLRFLRHQSASLPFGDAKLNLAGVDYQRFGTRYLRGAEKLIEPGAFNVLLSHNPDTFDVAARQGYDLTVSGHTHGGQVRFEILGADLNVARFYTPYVDGLYRQGAASIFVSRGLGTIGIPARLGAPPEVTLLRLCRI
ncbi:MAG TPA: metallophosphoesterase [Bryobacteraceae bacterium]|nr:metallophosphoesterase [Bryobacteraceae bacterium]